MKKESLQITTVKTLLAVLLFAGMGIIIIGGGYIIGEYSKNGRDIIIKPVNQETYYQILIKDCEKFKKSKLVTDYDCCLQSVEIMKKGNFKLTSENICPDGFQINSFWCVGAHSWCEPIEEIDWKNCNQDSDCVETQADCCGCNSGGEQIGINKEFLKTWENSWKSKCQNVGCIALFNCKEGEAICENNQCEFREKINNDDQLDTSDWQTYRNEEFGFEMKYPKEEIDIIFQDKDRIYLENKSGKKLTLSFCLFQDLKEHVEASRLGQYYAKITYNNWVYILNSKENGDCSQNLKNHISGKEVADIYKGECLITHKNNYVKLNLEDEVYYYTPMAKIVFLNISSEKIFNQIISTFKFIEK